MNQPGAPARSAPGVAARRTDLSVVADGVERTDHFGFLAAAGCDVAQGYVISFPQPPEALDLDAIHRAAAPMLPGRDAPHAPSAPAAGDLTVHRV